MPAFLVKALIGGLVVAGGAGTVVAVASSNSGDTTSDRAVVERVIDGDTVDVRIDGDTTRIRLLNVDTPETKDPNRDVECLGPEATTYLTTRLPVGSEVTLEYDTVRRDRYGRTLAGVVTEAGVLVNAEIAREGLGIAVEFDGNVRFLDQVRRAQGEAEDARRGLYSPEVACTVPGQVRIVSATTDTTATSSADLSTAADGAARTAAVATALLARFDGPRPGLVWAALDAEVVRALADDTRRAQSAATSREATLRTSAGEARVREETAARETADRQAREKVAEEKAAREKAARDATRSRPPTGTAPSGGSGSSSGGGSASDPYPGYTGPRCYAPGGKTYKPC